MVFWNKHCFPAFIFWIIFSWVSLIILLTIINKSLSIFSGAVLHLIVMKSSCLPSTTSLDYSSSHRFKAARELSIFLTPSSASALTELSFLIIGIPFLLLLQLLILFIVITFWAWMIKSDISFGWLSLFLIALIFFNHFLIITHSEILISIKAKTFFLLREISPV